MVRGELDYERHLSDTLWTTICCHAARVWVVAMAASKSVGTAAPRQTASRVRCCTPLQLPDLPMSVWDGREESGTGTMLVPYRRVGGIMEA